MPCYQLALRGVNRSKGWSTELCPAPWPRQTYTVHGSSNCCGSDGWIRLLSTHLFRRRLPAEWVSSTPIDESWGFPADRVGLLLPAESAVPWGRGWGSCMVWKWYRILGAPSVRIDETCTMYMHIHLASD